MFHEIFPQKKDLSAVLNHSSHVDLKPVKTRLGLVLGSTDFIKRTEEKFDRRTKTVMNEKRRINESYGEVSEIIANFERNEGIRIQDINARNYTGKRQRAKLLVLLKEQGGRKYSEIIHIPLFRKLKQNALSSIYRNAKKIVL